MIAAVGGGDLVPVDSRRWTMSIEFSCGHCGQRLGADPSKVGQVFRCPNCQEPVTVPAPSPEPAGQPQGDAIFCMKCGERNAQNNFRCTRCGYVLHGPDQPGVALVADATMGGLIPLKNSRALLAYYFGVFSLIPCVGIPLGIAALVLGIRGLRYAGRHPEAKGHVHAWVGIVLGALCSAGYTALIVALIIAGAMGA
jgi:DNA-directed RNA polymerase subunit RPC12/RpoP